MSRSSLVNRPRALMIDLSGTIHIEDKPIPGAVEAGTLPFVQLTDLGQH